MGIPPSFTLLVATVGVMSLPTPHFRPAFRTAVALATVAADTDRECGPASRVAANQKAKNGVVVDVYIRHKERLCHREQVESQFFGTNRRR
jgi:hypothetical protein